MKICRFQYKNSVQYGKIENEMITVINNNLFDDKIVFSNENYRLNDVEILTPIENPSKIVCVGLNYKAHAKELNMDILAEPTLFLKAPSSLLAHHQKIIKPNLCKELSYEAELAIVVGKDCKNINANDAQNYILGYTALNDVTARDLQRKDGQWVRSKSFDTFCPIGPYIQTDLNINDTLIEAYKNGECVQSDNTSNMIYNVYQLFEFVSSCMTLNKGDIIATGTPSGVGEMISKDKIEISIQGIGILSNQVQ